MAQHSVVVRLHLRVTVVEVGSAAVAVVVAEMQTVLELSSYAQETQ